ncbi:tripartite tricarboxylate transporter permease [Candidatus Woesearchaeota archaeon]|nr:tripartite tricarboxylate transporter permease [Candidatus Woesearchaeota archaeon]
MILNILISIFGGVIAGMVTGFTPGIHINLIAATTVATAPTLLKYTDTLNLVTFILAMSVTHTFLDTIPATFLGVPEADTALAVLPAHRMVQEGNGIEAVQLTVIGSLIGLISATLLLIPMVYAVEKGYPFVQQHIGAILIGASAIVIYKEKRKRLWALTIFFMAGALGMAVTTMPKLTQPLFPLLSGLFGVSNLVISLKNRTTLPKQKKVNLQIRKREVSKAITGGMAAATLSGFLPGLGAAQAAIIATSMFRKITEKGYLVVIGAINTIIMVISVIALYTIDKARNGSIVAIAELLEMFNKEYLVMSVAVMLIAGGLATVVAIKSAPVFAKLIEKVSYKKLSLSIILILTIMTMILSGWVGFVVLVTATALGIIPSVRGIGKNHLMGCLLIPVIFFFLQG